MTKTPLPLSDGTVTSGTLPPALTKPLTPTMLRELRAIERTGEVGDLLDYGFNALAFYAREKTLTALLQRDLIASEPGGYVVTSAGSAALSAAQGDAP